MSQYASFQGRVYLGKRDLNGNPTDLRPIGNVSELEISFKTDTLEHYESMSGQRAQDHRMIKTKSSSISLTIDEFTRENLALALYGTAASTIGGTVTDEPVGGLTPVIGDRYPLAHPKASTVVVKDSAGTPATLTAGTHYTVDANFGSLQFLNVTGFTAPFKASYAYGAVEEIGIFTQPLPERYLRLEGVNTAQSDSPILVELYRVAFDPLKKLSLISNDYNKFELEGSLLSDSTKPYDAAMGQTGRIVQIGL